MSHLGADTAAYVDGQLSESAMRAADAHLRVCEECERDVRQQRLLKSRMSTVSAPEPTSDLIDTLTRLQAVPPASVPWWVRLQRAAPVTIGLALVGASLAVVAVAYVVGGSEHSDQVRPSFDSYAAEFFGATATAVAASYTVVAPERLDSEGWPCHERLAGNLERVSAGYDRTDDVVAVAYTDGTSRLRLYEQPGRLDPSALRGFARVRLGQVIVWLRTGSPTVATWDRDGIVYTIVTDVDDVRLARAVAELPEAEEQNPLQRVGAGLDRMTAWAAA